MRHWLALAWLLLAACAEPTSSTVADVLVAPTTDYFIRCAEVPEVPVYVLGVEPVRACALLKAAVAGFARMSPDSVPPTDLANLEGALIHEASLLLIPADSSYAGIQGAVWSVSLLPRDRDYLLDGVTSRVDGREHYYVQRNVTLRPEARPRWPAISVVGKPTLVGEPSPFARRARTNRP